MTLQISGRVQGDHLPPMSLEMEQCVLGAMLIEAQAIEIAISALKVGDFYSPAHQVVFEAITELYQASDPVDLYTVQQKLKSMGVFDKIEGSQYLVQLLNAPPSAANVRYYSEQVAECSTRRKLLEVSSRIASLAYDADTEIEHVRSASIDAVHGACEGTVEAEILPASTAVGNALAEFNERVLNPGRHAGLSTGLTELDFCLQGLHNGNLIIVAARPAMGKSAMAMQIAQHVAMSNHNAGAAVIFSLEMTNNEVIARMASNASGVSGKSIMRAILNHGDKTRVQQAMVDLMAANLHFCDIGGRTCDEIASMTNAVRRTSKIGLIVVDYLQLVSGRGNTSNRTGEIDQVVMTLKEMAKRHNCPVIALSQLSRQVEARPDKRPMMSDLRESGGIEAAADVVMALYSPDYYDREHRDREWKHAEVGILKNRHGESGEWIPLRFDGQFARFSTLTDHDRAELDLPEARPHRRMPDPKPVEDDPFADEDEPQTNLEIETPGIIKNPLSQWD